MDSNFPKDKLHEIAIVYAQTQIAQPDSNEKKPTPDQSLREFARAYWKAINDFEEALEWVTSEE